MTAATEKPESQSVEEKSAAPAPKEYPKHANIHEAIVGAMRDVGAISKSRQNTQQNYQFRGIDDVYNELHDILAKHGIFTVPEVVGDLHEERVTGKGNLLIYRVLKIRFAFCHESGSMIMAGPIVGEGMDSGDKASNKAHAVAHKYALLQVFAIPTNEPKDPENESPQGLKPRGQAAPPENRQQPRQDSRQQQSSPPPSPQKFRAKPTNVEDIAGKNGKKGYFVVHFGESKVTTFSKSLADAARSAIAAQRTCLIEIEKNGKFTNLLNLEFEA